MGEVFKRFRKKDKTKMKLCPADTAFSKYLRTLFNWTCERCGAKHEEKSRGLHCSHYYSRKAESTRHDLDNCDCLCYGCHSYFSYNREAYTEWKKKKLGKKRFNDLTLRNNLYKRKDRKLEKIIWTEELKKLKDGLAK